MYGYCLYAIDSISFGPLTSLAAASADRYSTWANTAFIQEHQTVLDAFRVKVGIILNRPLYFSCLL